MLLTYSAHTAAGAEPGGLPKQNQDAWAVKERLAPQQASSSSGGGGGNGGGDMALFCVFDGHGADGRAVSNHVCGGVPRLVARSPLLRPATLESCLAAAFVEANRALRASPAVDCSLSGSTGVAALLTPAGKLVVANLGDSRCVAGRLEARGSGGSGGGRGVSAVTAVALTSDHTPADAAEADRIIASGVRFVVLRAVSLLLPSCLHCAPRTLIAGADTNTHASTKQHQTQRRQGRIATYTYNDEPLGPPRVWLRDANVPGLCMTRSFGDAVAASVGVIDAPEVVTYDVTTRDRYVILMSDGVFEFIDSQEVLDLVHAAALKGHGPNEAARQLVREARARWREEEADIVDDCTAVVIYVSHPPPPAPPAAAAAAAQQQAANGFGAAAAAPPGRLQGGARSGSGSGSGGAGGAAARILGLAGRLEATLRLGGASSPAGSSSGSPAGSPAPAARGPGSGAFGSTQSKAGALSGGGRR